MSFSKIRLGVEDIFELLVKDETGRVIDKWVCMKRDFPEVMQIISRKHGMQVKVINLKDKKKDRDLDWVK